MAVTVRIPTPLRKNAGDQSEVQATGKNVKEVLLNLGKTYPDLGAKLHDDGGKLRRYVNFFLNDQDIRDLAGAETAVKDGDTLSIMPAIAGG